MERDNEEENEKEEVGLGENIPFDDQCWRSIGDEPKEKNREDQGYGDRSGKPVSPLMVGRNRGGGTNGIFNERWSVLVYVSQTEPFYRRVTFKTYNFQNSQVM